MSINEAIRDDLVAHDIDLRRVDGDVRNKIDRRFDQLNRELKELLVRHDVHGASRLSTKQRRLKKYEVDARKAINEAFSEINTLVGKTLRGIAEAEAAAIVDTIQENMT